MLIVSGEESLLLQQGVLPYDVDRVLVVPGMSLPATCCWAIGQCFASSTTVPTCLPELGGLFSYPLLIDDRMTVDLRAHW